MPKNTLLEHSRKQVMDGLIHYSNHHGDLLHKFNDSYFLQYFDRNTIEQLESVVPTNQHLSDRTFIRTMTSFIVHRPSQTLFLVISLLSLFQKVCRFSHKDRQITIKDFTCYLCGVISAQSEYRLQVKEVYRQKSNPQPDRIRNIDQNPPAVVQAWSQALPKIAKNNKKRDRRVDGCRPIATFCINQRRKQIIILGRLAPKITILNYHLKEVKAIEPQCFKLFDKNMTILAMAFSQRQQRIGVIISQIGLAFWDYEDDFQSEKVIRKVQGNSIYFLPLLNQWVTTTSNKIIMWDLKEDRQKFVICEPGVQSVQDLREITHLRCLAVAYTMEDQLKWLYIYKNKGLKVGTKFKLGRAGAQKIHYNRQTQTIMLIGINQLIVYQIDGVTFDITLLKTLKGHESIINGIADIGRGLVLTGDDKGTVRMWDLKEFRCIQVIKVSNTLNKMAFVGDQLIYSDARINIIQLEQASLPLDPEQMHCLKKFYCLQSDRSEVYMFTPVNCRIYDMKTGRVVKVVELTTSQNEIITVEKYKEDFIVSTIQGGLTCWNESLTLKWSLSPQAVFDQEIIMIKSDPKHGMFTTVSKHGNVMMWSQKTLKEEGPRKFIRNSDKDKKYQIRLFDQAEQYGLLVTAQNSSGVKVWDYQSFKLCHMIELEQTPCALKLAQQFPMLGVACLNEKLYLYKLLRKQSYLQVKCLHIINLRYPANALNSLISLVSGHSIPEDSGKKSQETAYKSLNAQSIVFNLGSRHLLMLVTYGKGNVITFNLTSLRNTFYRERTFFKVGANMQRPIRQTFKKQILNSQYHITSSSQISSGLLGDLSVMWNKKVHREKICDLDIVLEKYVSTSAVDGYYQLLTLEQGKSVCCLSIKHPLPILWDIDNIDQIQLVSSIRNALNLLSEILSDPNQQLTSKQHDKLNVVPFLSQFFTQKPVKSSHKKMRSVHLMKEELAPEDLRQPQVEPSLKHLQAIRRVNQMKSVAEEECQYPPIKPPGTSQKDSFIKMFSPSYTSQLEQRKQNNLSLFGSFFGMKHHSVKVSPQKTDKYRESTPKSSFRPYQGQITQKLIYLTKSKLKMSVKPSIARSLSQSLSTKNEEQEKATDKLKLFKEKSQNLRRELSSNRPLKTINGFMKQLTSTIIEETSGLRKKKRLQSKFEPFA